MNAAARKRLERDRMRSAGFVLKHTWVHRDDWPRVVKYLNAVSVRRNRLARQTVPNSI